MKKLILIVIIYYTSSLFSSYPGGELRAQISQDTTDSNVIVTGAVTGNGAYATLAEAFAAINSGPQTGANIIINFNQGTTEQLTAVLNHGTWASLRIEPVGNCIISGAIAPGSPLIDLNGADNVTIDGLNSEGSSLTISNTTVSSSANTSTIRFRNDATNNVITRCKILGSSTSAVGTVAGNILFGGAAISTGNDNNVVSYCDIGPAGSNLPSKGIYFSGTTTNPTLNNSENTVIGCNIYDYFSSLTSSSGVYIRNGSTAITVKQNKFYQTAPKVHTANSLHTAISVLNTSGNSYSIDSNIIGFIDTTGVGFYTISGASNDFKGIYLSVGTSTPTNVQGNVISSINHSTAGAGIDEASPCVMIHISNGLVHAGNIARNLIGNMSATDNIIYTSSNANTSGIIGIGNFGVSDFVCNKNLIGGITALNSGTGASNIYCIRVSTTPTVVFTCQANTIGGTVANSIHSITTSNLSIVRGITYGSSSGTITGNNIKNLTASGGIGINASASVIGINVNMSPATNHIVSQNTIHSLTNTNSSSAAVVTGIHSEGNVNATKLFENNFIHSLVINNNSSTMNGIETQSFGTASFQNNMIRLGINAAGNSVSHGAKVNGIKESNGANDFYFNSVYIGGFATSGSSNTSAFSSDVIVQTRNYENNIFFNARSYSGSTGKHYAAIVGGSQPDPEGLTMNYNVLFANGSGGILGHFSGADRTNLSAWQTATGQDNNSYEVDPHFENPTGSASTVDLHIDTTVATIIESRGIDIPSVLYDYDGETRSALTPTDIGADAGDFIPYHVLKIKMFIEGFYDASTNTQTPDTITVEERGNISPYPILLSIRKVVSENGVVFIDPGTTEQFWIVLKHRNSIETWSANPVFIIPNDTTEYDFTTSASQAYGNNMKQVDTAPMRFAIYSGDTNGDGVVDASDLLQIDNDAFNFITGYVDTDVNGDGVVDASDAVIADNNASNFITKITP